MTLVANHSSYPKIGERPEEQKLRRAYDKWDRKEISEELLEKTIQEVIEEAASEQARAGVDLVTDGQIRWYDPISHWMGTLKGVKVGGLLRFFDTNCYFRVPRAEGSLERRDGTSLRQDLITASRSAKRPVKAVLTGPVTLGLLSERGSGYKKVEDLIQDLGLLLAEEVVALAAEGATWIQVEEPILLKKPEYLPLLTKILRSLDKKKGKARLLLATYFGDATSLYGKFLDLPVDGLGFDGLYGPGLLEKVAKEGCPKALALGVLDGRSTRLEEVEPLKKPLERIRLALEDRELHLTTSCGLEYLPRARAFEKLTLLAKLKEALER